MRCFFNPVMFRQRLLLIGVFFLTNTALHAQIDAPALLSALSKQAQGLTGLSGTIVRQEKTLVGQQTWQDQLSFSAPDKIRVETTKVSGEGRPPRQISVAVDKESWLWIPETKVASHWNRNLLLQWVGMVGGPANVAGFFTGVNALGARYSLRTLSGPPINGHPTRLLDLNEKEPQAPLVRDVLRAGGIFPLLVYASFKRPLYLQPPKIQLYFDVDTMVLVRREHYDEKGRLVFRADCKEIRKIGDHSFPALWDLTDGNGNTVSHLEYRDLQWNPKINDATFVTDFTDQYVVAEQEPQSIADWRDRVAANPKEANAHYNLAITLLRHLEEAPAALQELNETIKLRPRAVAPWVSAGDVYSVSWDLRNALTACQKAMELDPDDTALVGPAVRVLLQQNNLEQASDILRLAIEKVPRNPHWHLMVGEIYQRMGKIEAAAREYKKVITEDEMDRSTPDQLLAIDDLVNLCRWSGKEVTVSEGNAAAMKLTGDRLLIRQQFAEALAKYAEATKAAPENMLLKFSVAQSLMRWERSRDAAKYYAEIAEGFPDTSEGVASRHGLIALAAENGETEAAWTQFRNLMKNVDSEQGKDLERHFLIGAFQKRFKHDALLQFLNARSQAGDPEEHVYRLLADLYLWEGERGKAMAALRAGCYKLPDNDVMKSVLIDLMTEEARRAEPESNERKRKFQEAQREAERLVRARPSQPYYYAQLVFLYQFSGSERFDEALETAQRLVKRFPEDPDSYGVLGTLYLDRVVEPSSPLTPLLKALESGVSYGSRHEEVFFLRQGLSGVSQQSGAVDKILQQYQRLLQRSTGSQERINLYSTLMAILAKNQRMDLGLLYLHKLLKTEYPLEEKTLVMNLVFSSVGKKTEFDDSLRKSISANLTETPQDPYWVLLDAVMKSFSGQSREGITGYQQAARLAPEDATVAFWLAGLYSSGEDYRSAIAEYERAVRLDPSQLEPQVRLAICYYKTAQLNRSLEVARQMMVRLPNGAEALRTLAALYRECGKLSEAVNVYREAASLTVSSPDTFLSDVIAIQFDLADALASNGNHASAEEILKRLTLRQCGIGNRLSAYRGLSRVFLNEKRLDDAKQALGDAAKIAPDESTRKELQQQLVNLRLPE